MDLYLSKINLKTMNFLSVFDGHATGKFCLDLVGIKYSNYFASEIDKAAIMVANDNHKGIIHLGNVVDLNKNNLPNIGGLIGGSPCQGFSFSGKMLNFDDPRSKLFFEFVRLKNELKPKFWLLENVDMKQEYQDVITKYLGVKPIRLNSKLTSAQNRERLYWANFDITVPEDQGIELKDILEDKEMLHPAAIRGRRVNDQGKREDNNKSIPMSQCLEVRSMGSNKSHCLTTVEKDTVLTSLPKGRYKDAFKSDYPYRNYTKKERCRLMNLPDHYCDSISLNQTIKAMGNGWDAGMITHIFKDMKKAIDKKPLKKKYKILNLYACVGGNRAKWDEVFENTEFELEVTAVELDPYLADMYRERFPNDIVVVGDAHQYLLDHYKEFDFVWGSPPCPTHGKIRFSQKNKEFFIPKYADMGLYQEIIFLMTHFEGGYCIENVIPYYEPLIPAQKRGRHLYWTNFKLPKNLNEREEGRGVISKATIEIKVLSDFHEVDFYKYRGTQRKDKIARNLVDYEVGRTIMEANLRIFKEDKTNQEYAF